MPTAVGGMSIGADPITAAVITMSGVRGTPLLGFMVRKEPKGHGTNQYIEGPVKPGDTAVIVEDVVTTGGSSLQAIERAETFGLKIAGVLAIIDRMEGGAEAFTQRGYKFASLSRSAISASSRRKRRIVGGDSRRRFCSCRPTNRRQEALLTAKSTRRIEGPLRLPILLKDLTAAQLHAALANLGVTPRQARQITRRPFDAAASHRKRGHCRQAAARSTPMHGDPKSDAGRETGLFPRRIRQIPLHRRRPRTVRGRANSAPAQAR